MAVDDERPEWMAECSVDDAGAGVTGYSVHDEPDFARTYDEDDIVEIRRGDLRALLDVATGSMDFGSGFLDNEQVEVLRKVAEQLGIDPLVATPSNFVCVYRGEHQWEWVSDSAPSFFVLRDSPYGGCWYCDQCRHIDKTRPGPPPAEVPA